MVDVRLINEWEVRTLLMLKGCSELQRRRGRVRAEQVFERGDMVRVSEAGRWHGIKKEYALVVGFSRDGRSVRVITEGNFTVQNYHMDFWEPI